MPQRKLNTASRKAPSARSASRVRKPAAPVFGWPANGRSLNADAQDRPLVAILDVGGRLCGCTGAMEKLLGRPRTRLLDTPLMDHVHHADRSSCRMALQRLLAGHAPEELTVRMIRGDGTQPWIALRPSLSPERDAILLEASESRARREEPEKSLPSHLVLDEMDEGVLVIDATRDDLPILDTNPGFTRLAGYTRAESLGQPLHFLSNPRTDSVQLRRAIDLARAGNRASAEVQMSRKDGTELWVRLKLIPETGADGRVQRLFAIHLDVSERRMVFDALNEKNIALTEALESLQKTKEAIVQRERMHALGTMASGIAHDFNNLLSPILGFTELLLAFPAMLEDPVKVAAYLQKIRTAATDGAAVVSRLREFYRSRDDLEPPAELSVLKVMEETIELTRHRWKNEAQAAGQQVEIVADLQETPPVLGQESEIRQALTNLVLNALDAMPKGGTLRVRTYRVGTWACVQIADTGVGMSAETRRRCFEPFYTTKGKCGTGLGLSIVFGTIERHGGRVEVHSEQGYGTMFTLWLPVMRAIGAQPGQPEAPGSFRKQRPIRVMLVDDEDLLLEVVSEHLLGLGHSVDAFTDPNAALESFYKEHYDLVITDRAMPGMSGDQLALRIHEFRASTPVVLLTGFGSIIKQSGEQIQNITEVLAKPISQQTLRETLERFSDSTTAAA